MKVSQMGSQTSTANIERDKGTHTQNSICDNSNIIGGGSLELGMADEGKLNESIQSQKVEKGEEMASKTADVAIHTSKFDGEGNSSIDMPSF